MHEILPTSPATIEMYVVPMPTLPALMLSRPEEVALALEAAIFNPGCLPVQSVHGFRGGVLPVDAEGGNVLCEGGWTFVYGRTDEGCREAATVHAHAIREQLVQDDALATLLDMAMGRLATQLPVSRKDVDMATVSYAACLADHPYFS